MYFFYYYDVLAKPWILENDCGRATCRPTLYFDNIILIWIHELKRVPKNTSTRAKVFVKEWGILSQCYLLFINFICWNNLNPCTMYLKNPCGIHVIFIHNKGKNSALCVNFCCMELAKGHMGKLMCCMWLHAQIFIWFWEFHHLTFGDSYYNAAWFIQTTLIRNACFLILKTLKHFSCASTCHYCDMLSTN